MAYVTVEKKIDYFKAFVEQLRWLIGEPDGYIWSNGREILCKTKDIAEALADMLKRIYKVYGIEIFINIGYYEPVKDENNGEINKYSDWWYISID